MTVETVTTSATGTIFSAITAGRNNITVEYVRLVNTSAVNHNAILRTGTGSGVSANPIEMTISAVAGDSNSLPVNKLFRGDIHATLTGVTGTELVIGYY